MRIATDSCGHVRRSWITHFGIDSWYGRMNSANARSRYVRKESVLTCAAMKSVHASRLRWAARIGGWSASVCTISGMSCGIVTWMYRG